MDIDPVVSQQGEAATARVDIPPREEGNGSTSNNRPNSHVEPQSHQPSPSPEPPRLFNPIGDGGPQCYTRHECGDYIMYKHATAGASVGAGLSKVPWVSLSEEIDEKYDGNSFGIWGSLRNWEDAKWFNIANLSQVKINERLRTARYRDDPTNFESARKLFQMIKGIEGVGGQPFDTVGVWLPEAHLDKVKLHYRCPVECAKKLFGTARFQWAFSVAPEMVYQGDDKTRIHGNMWNGTEWHRIQGLLPPGATRGAVIFMSDATILSKYTGGVQVHGLYMSLGNIDKAVREDISKGTWMLVGFIPKSNFDKTMATLGDLSDADKTTMVNLLNWCLFHRCMEIITRPFRRTEPQAVMDPEGITRSVVFDLAVHGGDLEEQCTICGTERNSCPHCVCKGKALGEAGCQRLRSSKGILRNIKKVLADFHRVYHRPPNPLEFLKRGKQYGLNGVHKPFWRKLPHFDICCVLSPDLLHGYHKCYFDHIHKWNLTGLGADEYDARLKAQIPAQGERMFPKGVSKLKQLAGKEHRALERVGVAIVVHAPSKDEGGVGSNQLTKATRAYLNFTFLGQYQIHTDKTLADFEDAYQEFQRHKQVWVKNKSKRKKSKGKKISVNESWAIPKLHIACHAPEHIRLKGTLDNFNTETMEHLHRSHCKDPYDLTNHQPGWQKQVLRRLLRHEKMREYGEFLVWRQEQLRKKQQAAVEGTSDNENGVFPRNNALEDDQEEDEEDEEDRDEGVREEGEGDNGNEPRVHGENVVARGHPDRNRADLDLGASTLGAPRAPESLQSHPIISATDPVAAGNPHLAPVIYPKQPAQGWLALLPSYTKRPSPLLTSVQTFAISKRPAFSSVASERLLREVDIPDFLDDLAQHPYFSNMRTPDIILTRFHCWDSFRVRIPTSPFAPEPRLARIYAVSGLLKRGRKKPKPALTPRSDAVFYLPRDEPGFNHAKARLHGASQLFFSSYLEADNRFRQTIVWGAWF
ncbi:hypothetical protein FRC11_008938 [Ceratobasidium sp. 423]|nr:hypothetical protein FRC11_008938 [Ceratobasidium sp. 423]